MNDDHLLKKKKFYQLNFHSKIDKHFPTVCHFSANSNYEQGDDIQLENSNTYFIGLKKLQFLKQCILISDLQIRRSI